MVTLLTLDGKGILLAVVFGVALLLFGGRQGPFFLAVMLLFLALSALATNTGKRKKAGIGLYEHSRGWKNVLSNGIVPVAISGIYYMAGAGGVNSAIIIASYIASVAAVTADKFSSEIGVLDGEPRMLLTLKTAKKGVSGAVTSLGLGASLAGAAIIGMSALYVGAGAAAILAIIAAGVIGGVVDSVAGYFEEHGMGNKFTSNFFCSLAGALVCFAIILF